MIELPIGEMHDLLENDPWQQPDSDEKRLRQQSTDIQKQIYDRLNAEGFFDEAPFVDPPDDEDPSIATESAWTVFWRLTIHGKRIIEIVEMQPSIKKIAMAFKNTRSGCWIVFTGKRIASTIESTLNTHGISTILVSCDVHGQTGSGKSVLNAVDKAEGFFYCIATYGHQVKAHFVPESYWYAHEDVFYGDLGIIDLIGGQMKTTNVSYCYDSLSPDISSTKLFLDELGFRENLLFQALINETFGE